MSAEKKVITIKGEELPISQCRKFNKLYYKIGDINIQNSGDCYVINDKYYREETNLIVYNHSIKQYVILDNSLIKGVVDILENDLILGYFNTNIKYSKIMNKDGYSYVLFNPEIFKNNKEYREQLSSGDFYHISKLPSYKFNTILFPNKDYKYSLPYDSKGIIERYLKGYGNYNPEISKNIKNYTPLLGNLSFGLEFETTKGFIPNRILNQYGLIPLRDGSISGIEYVTVPMEGEKGLQCTADIIKVLKERTEYNDETCSLHLHLGNIPRTKEFILAFFKIGMKIQDEMFKMFPLYKKYNYHFKNKNYSAPLPTYEILSQLDSVIDSRNIDENFGVLYKYLSMGQDFKTVENNLDNVIGHPADPNGNHKWQITSRYMLFNVIPLLFGNKQTIEFRIHTPTYDINKIFPFIFMNSLIVNFTIANQEKILKSKSFSNSLDLFTILSYQIDNCDISSKSSFRDLMYNYIEKRKIYCERQILKGNILGTESEILAPMEIDWLINESVVKKNNPYKIVEKNTFKKTTENIPSSASEELLTYLKDYSNNTSLIDSNYGLSMDIASLHSTRIVTEVGSIKAMDNFKIPSYDSTNSI